MQVRDYKPRLSPDLSSVGTMVGYDTGFAGQSQLQFTDMLGDYSLTLGLGIYGSIKESDLYVSFLDRSGRTNWSVAAFQFRRRYATVGGLSLGLRDLQGGQLGLHAVGLLRQPCVQVGQHCAVAGFHVLRQQGGKRA